MEQVWLNWRGPYRLDRAYWTEASQGGGIYAICRKWGKASERILYIGEAYFQELGLRLKQHTWLEDLRGEIKVRFATVELEGGSKQSQRRAKDIEALLIFYHQPEYNIQNRNSYLGRELEITSYGRCGPIKREVYSDEL